MEYCHEELKAYVCCRVRVSGLAIQSKTPKQRRREDDIVAELSFHGHMLSSHHVGSLDLTTKITTKDPYDPEVTWKRSDRLNEFFA
jgi:hypothetical protein